MFRINQKVVCVEEIDTNPTFNETIPKLKEIYTIRDIFVGSSGITCFRLKEIINSPHQYIGGFMECGFDKDAFRPAVNVGDKICAYIESMPEKDLRKEFEK